MDFHFFVHIFDNILKSTSLDSFLTHCSLHTLRKKAYGVHLPRGFRNKLMFKSSRMWSENVNVLEKQFKLNQVQLTPDSDQYAVAVLVLPLASRLDLDSHSRYNVEMVIFLQSQQFTLKLVTSMSCLPPSLHPLTAATA